MFIITAMLNIGLHPVYYFFLSMEFFAFHLMLAYLVDHISIHAALFLASVVLNHAGCELPAPGWSGIRFAAVEAGIAQLMILIIFSYAFFWKGFTGLAITIIPVITLFVVMQATGRIRWSENGPARGAKAFD